MNRSTNGKKLYSKYWVPDSNITIKGIVFICHGWSEHSEWYDTFGNELASEGFLCASHDCVGHGLSDGNRGYIESIRVLMDDVLEHCKQLQSKYGADKKLFLFGHSMGGLISALIGIEKPELFTGIILSAPYLSVGSVSSISIFFGKIAAYLIPKMKILPRMPPQQSYRDPDIVTRVLQDKLYYHGGIHAQTAAQFLEYTNMIKQRMSEFKVPVLCIHGKSDSVISIESSREFINNCLSRDKKLIELEEAFHNLLNEPLTSRKFITDEIKNWLVHRI